MNFEIIDEIELESEGDFEPEEVVIINGKRLEVGDDNADD